MKNITDLMNQGKTEKQCKKLTTQGEGETSRKAEPNSGTKPNNGETH